MYLFLFCWVLCQLKISVCGRTTYDITNLVVEPDYRSVYLKWKYPSDNTLLGFNIRYCEITNWHSKVRCKEQLTKVNTIPNKIKLENDDQIIRLKQIDSERFEASINNLRMLTNYSVTVKAELNYKRKPTEQLSNSINDSEQSVQVETKSSKTLKCLANSSEIQVHTGPYFGGKISVEGSNNPLCAINGDRKSSQSVYNFSINHDICGSKIINNSRIEAMVIVHENKEILTHNSKRYLVVCTFAPESYTLTASVSVPNHLLKKLFDRMKEKQSTTDSQQNTTNELSDSIKRKRFVPHRFIETYSSKHSNLRDSRMLEQDGIVKRVIYDEDAQQSKLLRPQSTTMRRLFGNNIAMILAITTICALLFLLMIKDTLNVNRQSRTITGVNHNECQLITVSERKQSTNAIV